MKTKILSAIAIISIGLSSLSVSRADEPELETWDCSVAREQQVSNGRLTLSLSFCDQMILADGREKSWEQRDIEPYVKSAYRWLEVIEGVDGKAHHTISIRVLDEDTNGFAGPDDDGTLFNGHVITATGSLIIASHTYEIGFDQDEFNGTILHEMGHILGVTPMASDFITKDKRYGNIFKIPNSQAVKQYNQIYRANVDFLPISDDKMHLYDNIDLGDKTRYYPNKKKLPAMTEELMANGYLIGRVTLGLLDDIGYQVNYSKADRY